MRAMTACLCAICVLTFGCQDDEYRVVTESTERGFVRSIVVEPGRPGGRPVDPEVVEPEIGEAELEHLTRIYGGSFGRLLYSGSFQERIPDDLQGAGLVTRIDAPLGTVIGYVERPRGERDAGDSLERMLSAQDLLITLMLEDVETRFGDREWCDELLRVIDTSVRSEMQTVALELWRAGPALRTAETDFEAEESDAARARATASAGALAHVMLHLVESGYVGPRDALHMSLTGLDVFDLSERMAREIILGILTPGIGASAASEVAAAYGGEEDDDASDERVKDWEARWGGSLATAAFGIDGLLEHYDVVNLAFSSPEAPLITNGDWDPLARVVRWSFRIPADPENSSWQAPTAFGVWVLPNRERQETLFGRVALEHQELADHVFWVDSLDEENALAWRQFLDRVSSARGVERARIIEDAAESHPALEDGTSIIRLFCDYGA